MDDLFNFGNDTSNSAEGSYLAAATTSLQSTKQGARQALDDSVFGGPCEGLPFEEKVGRLLSVFEVRVCARVCTLALMSHAAWTHIHLRVMQRMHTRTCMSCSSTRACTRVRHAAGGRCAPECGAAVHAVHGGCLGGCRAVEVCHDGLCCAVRVSMWWLVALVGSLLAPVLPKK